MDCSSCRSLSGEARISPGEIILKGNFWTLEHAYPVKLKGWLVLVLNRHVESFHELSEEETQELGPLLKRVTAALHAELDTRKEYISFFAEKEGFSHVHVHIVPRAKDLPKELKGPAIFSLLKTTEAETISPEEVIQISSDLKRRIGEVA